VAAIDLADVFRAEWPRIFATLVRYTGSIELAEDSIQMAFERAANHPDRSLLINPGAWITTVAKRAAIDSVRRDADLRRKLPRLADPETTAEPQPDPIGNDDRLGMLFVA
jgi:RNA polymerase sigma-70 factor (ECF subfamily)